MTNRKRRTRRGECGQERHTPATQHPQSRANAAKQPAEPAQTAAAEEQIGDRLRFGELDRPEQLGSEQATDHASDRRVGAFGIETAALEFPCEDPDADECGDTDQYAEARDLEVADAEQDRIHSIHFH